MLPSVGPVRDHCSVHSFSCFRLQSFQRNQFIAIICDIEWTITKQTQKFFRNTTKGKSHLLRYFAGSGSISFDLVAATTLQIQRRHKLVTSLNPRGSRLISNKPRPGCSFAAVFSYLLSALLQTARHRCNDELAFPPDCITNVPRLSPEQLFLFLLLGGTDKGRHISFSKFKRMLMNLVLTGKIKFDKGGNSSVYSSIQSSRSLTCPLLNLVCSEIRF